MQSDFLSDFLSVRESCVANKLQGCFFISNANALTENNSCLTSVTILRSEKGEEAENYIKNEPVAIYGISLSGPGICFWFC